MPENFEEQVKSLNAALKQVGDQIKASAEQTQKDIQRTGEMNAEMRAKVDELLTKQGELQARMVEAEQKLIHGSGGGSGGKSIRKTAGQLVAESEQLQGRDSSSRFVARVSMPRAALTSFDTNGNQLPAGQRLPEIYGGGFRRLTLRDLIAPGQTGAPSIEYVRESGFTNNAGPVAEGAAASYSEIAMTLETASVRNISHLFKVSKNMLDDLQGLQSYIDARAANGLLLAEESQMLYGSGVAPQLEGLCVKASAFAYPTGTAGTETYIDRLRLALLQAELAEFPSDGIVLHPTDWALIELLKDGNGQYLIGKPHGGTIKTLWNRPVVETQAIAQNEFLAGAFKMGAQIYDRSEAEVMISTENGDDFEKGLATIKAEERLALAIYRDEAFVTGELTGAVA
jgi:HK97 family phage major capsid protein